MRTEISNIAVAFKIPSTFNEKLEKYAELEMTSKSALIRNSVAEKFRHLDKKYDSYTSLKKSTWKKSA